MSIRLGTQIVAGNAIVVPENIYLKTTYDGGTSGYRIWSDGYCEQWGYIAQVSSSSVSFIKTYKNTNYSIYTQSVRTDESGGGFDYCSGILSMSVSGFSLSAVNKTGSSTRWKTCGYLAAGQY